MKKMTSMELVYHKILEKIMTEKLTPGTPLREERIAEEFKVSATPVREAFRRLEYEGWLESAPFRGCFLRKFSRREFGELYELREALEGMVAAAAAREASQDGLDAIRRTLDEERRYIDEAAKQKAGDPVLPTLYQDIDFHAAIADAADNKLLKQRLTMLKSQITIGFMIGHGKAAELADLEKTFEEHRMIFNAIERRWSDLAEALMRRHISEAGRKLLADTGFAGPEE